MHTRCSEYQTNLRLNQGLSKHFRKAGTKLGMVALAALILSVFTPDSSADQTLSSPNATAEKTANDQIEQQLKNYTESLNKKSKYSKIEYEVTLPDPRLNLETCQQPLSIENRSSSRRVGRLTLKVGCHAANKPWAVNISVNIMAYDEVVVSSRPIPRHSKIMPGMLTTIEREVTSLHSGYFKSTKHIIGAIAKYSIGGNRVLKPGSVLPPKLVTKGEKVVIKANTQGLSIRTSGVALNDGAMGEVVKVKNTRTTRIIEGRVSAAGQVTVSM